MKIKAPAKINLSLRVTAKRDDGFHEIVSLMQPLALSDVITITVEDGTGIAVSCDDPEIPTGSGNLVHKAARIFMDVASIGKKVNIHIEKHIPVSAGLGGGSSDAASTLMAMNELTDGLLDDAQLLEIAAELGSDVPFFLLSGSAIAKGRGELLTPVKLPEYSYILINPGFPVSAGWAYSNLTLTETPHNIKIMDSEEFAVVLLERPSKVVDILENDLERAVAQKHPEIQELSLALKDSGAGGVLMSGSGPTVFGVFLDEERAASAMDHLTNSLKGLGNRIILTKGL